MNLLKRKPLGYVILILNTGYETIPNIKCQISKSNTLVKKIDNSYWYHNKVVKILPLYKKDMKHLISLGYDLENYTYFRYLGYDNILKYNRRKILKLII